jgi:hypothetical protein
MSGKEYSESDPNPSGPTQIGITLEDLRKTGKSRAFAMSYDTRATVGETDGGVAQGAGARDWYALANSLAEKALSEPD